VERNNIISENHFESLRHVGDDLADQAFLSLKKNKNIAATFYSLETNSELVKSSFDDEKFQEFINFYKSYYASIDLGVLVNGQSFFQKYTGEILAMLGFYSLPYCYAGAKGVRVLYLSKKIKEDPERRLLETGQFVFDVSETNSFGEQGKALVSIARVRLMHAAARHYTQAHIPDEIAVNQEDLLATLMSFSLISIRGLRKIGISIRKEESLSFIGMWNEIGLLLGIRPEILPKSINEAANMERLIRKRQFKYSMEGAALTKSLLDFLSSQEISGIRLDTKGYMAMLLGNEVASYVGVKASNIEVVIFKNIARTRSLFTEFSEKNYSAIKKQLNKTVEQKSLKAKFKAI
jgi:hypothetical protein